MSDKTVRRRLTFTLCSVTLAALAACGGGGGGGTASDSGSASGTTTSAGSTGASGAGSTSLTGGTASSGSAASGGDAGATASAGSGGSSSGGATVAGGAGTGSTGSADAFVPQGSPATQLPTAGGGSILGDCPMFPSNAIFNSRIDGMPVHANSANWINLVGGATPLMPNWGNSSNPAHTWDYWGLPINVIDSSQSNQTHWPIVHYDNGYPHRSDCATSPGGGVINDCSGQAPEARRFPFPAGNVLKEGNGDAHVLVVDKGACRLWEAFYASDYGNGQWGVVTTATWDLRSNALRPDASVSADAAGLPITPLLARASEAATGEIRHAMRVTFRNQFMSVKYNWPARAGIGLEMDQNIPFGSLLRLRADFVVPDNWSPQAKAVANAFKRYGLYVADNGQDFFVQGEPSDGWDPVAWQQLRTLTLQQMEFVDLSPVTSHPNFDRNSMQASW